MATNDTAKKKHPTSRAEAGLVEEDAEIQPQDEAISDQEHIDFDAVEDEANLAGVAPSSFKISGMSEEEQYMDMQPVIVGPPAYGSPSPLTSVGRLLPLESHPLAAQNLPEGTEGSIDPAYGEGYAGTLTAGELGSQFPGAPQRTDLERDSAGELDARLAEQSGTPTDYNAMTKDELLSAAQARGLDVTASNTKAEIVSALQAADAA